MSYLQAPEDDASRVWLDWMQCANEECGELVIRIHEGAAGTSVTLHADGRHTPDVHETRSWMARPRALVRPVDPLVPDPYRTDYQEAAAILDLSPRMSAVLSRSVLADLLEGYAKLAHYNLSKRIDEFRTDERHPSVLRAGMHHFREIADFGAHTQKSGNDQAVIPVSREDAEWMLEFLDRAFDYFIVGPEKDRKMTEKWDKRLDEAGRKPIPPLPEDSES